MKKIKNIHPGEILLEEFLIPMEISVYKRSKDMGKPQTRVLEIIKRKRSLTADTTLRLSVYFGTSPKFWLGLQNDFDIEEIAFQPHKMLSSIKRHKVKVA